MPSGVRSNVPTYPRTFPGTSLFPFWSPGSKTQTPTAKSFLLQQPLTPPPKLACHFHLVHLVLVISVARLTFGQQLRSEEEWQLRSEEELRIAPGIEFRKR